MHLLAAMVRACDDMEFASEVDAGLTSSKLAFRTALMLLHERERQGADEAGRRLKAARETVCAALALPDRDIPGDAQAALIEMLSRAEQRVSEAAALDASTIARLCLDEAEAIAMPGSDEAGASAVEIDTSITLPRLERYLRRRTGHAGLTVDGFRPLMGGFGKETYIFSATGGNLDGEFVIRRDQPVELIPGACHGVSREYPVLRAVRARGFPAPDSLWLETGCPELPGPDFIVMRRSKGGTRGTLSGATGEVDPALNEQLGAAMGRLHSLPALRELGDLTESIRVEMWDRSGEEITGEYISTMRALLLDNPHAPSLATVAAWNWLAEHIPAGLSGPSLIHGDIGFHNMLLDGQELVCLLDWENAQIGHAGMDLGYVYNAAHDTLDWARVMQAYEGAGGIPLSDRDLLFFRIMMFARIATTVNVGPSHLFTGNVPNLRLLNAEIQFRPPVLRELAGLITEYAAIYENVPG